MSLSLFARSALLAKIDPLSRARVRSRCEIEPLLAASMATTLLEGLVSSALAGNELFESLFRAAGPCLLVEA